jgi:hypothetical protein
MNKIAVIQNFSEILSVNAGRQPSDLLRQVGESWGGKYFEKI